MSGWPPSWVCFYCRNPINKRGRFITTLRTHNVRGGSRDALRRFHVPCFHKFEFNGRPWNPWTDFEVLTAKVFLTDETLAIMRPGQIRSIQAQDPARPSSGG